MEFEVKDRVAIGDNKYIITTLEDGRVQLEPSPDAVLEEGTPINKELLQPLVDAVPVVFELTKDEETNAPSFQNGQTAEQLVGLLEEKRNVIVKVGNNSIYSILDFVGKITTPITPAAYIFQSTPSTFPVTYILTESGFSQGINTPISDYVIEEGSTNGWAYRKWASGIAECWGKVDAFSGTQSPYGNMYVSSEITALKDKPYPFEFVETPNVTLGLETAGFSGIILSGEIHSKQHIGTFYLGTFVLIGDDRPITVHAQVIGRWE